MSLIFYDTETTGLDPYFDQVLQFAAIKTDEDFNELDRFEIRCRLLPHIVPHPMAMLVTGVTADMLTDSELPSHYEMMSAIRNKLMSWGQAIYIGYNSIRYDEAMLRSAFYQTLHPIYLTNTNGNGRTDALQLMQAASVFAPGLLNIPVNDKGKPVFKLDQLAPANGFSHEHAHDALADVEATIYMAKRVADEAPELWRRLRACGEKRRVVDFIESSPAFLLTEFYFNTGYSRPVAPIGNNPYNPSVMFALSLDDAFDELTNMNDAELSKHLSSTPRPVRKIKTNASPLVTSLKSAATYPQFQALDMEKTAQRASLVQNDTELRHRIIAAMSEIEGPFEDNPDAEVEEQIYAGFYSRRDEGLLSDFHAAKPIERVTISDRFEDVRLRSLAKRQLFFEDPELLSAIDRASIQKSFAERFASDDVDRKWLTPAGALAALEDIQQKADEDQKLHLHRLRSLYEAKAQTFSA